MARDPESPGHAGDPKSPGPAQPFLLALGHWPRTACRWAEPTVPSALLCVAPRAVAAHRWPMPGVSQAVAQGTLSVLVSGCLYNTVSEGAVPVGGGVPGALVWGSELRVQVWARQEGLPDGQKPAVLETRGGPACGSKCNAI